MILKLKQTPGIYIVGFMGSGKTTVARALAQRIGSTFVDIDDDIEAAEQSRIARIFEERGEAEFRRVESLAIQRRVSEVQSGHPTVLALGGGAFIQPQNREILETRGVTLWLDCPFDLVCRRVDCNGHRPLARDPQRFRELYFERRDVYAQAAYKIEITTDDLNVTLDRILELPFFA